MLPHAFPFRLFDPLPASPDVATGELELRLSAAAAGLRDGPWPPMLAVEALAQAAMVILARPQATAPRAYLAGLESIHFDLRLVTRPLLAGDLLRVSAEEKGSFGRLLKVGGELRRSDGPLVRGDLLLALAAQQ